MMQQIVSNTKFSANLWQKMSKNGQGFSAVTGFVTVAGTSEVDFILIKNPANSNVLCRLKEFIMTINSATAQRSIIRFYRTPTITSDGTPIAINKVLASGSVTSELEVYQTPTISDRDTLIQMFIIENVTYPRDQDLGRYLVENADLLITVQGTTTNIEHNIVSVWAEEPI